MTVIVLHDTLHQRILTRYKGHATTAGTSHANLDTKPPHPTDVAGKSARATTVEPRIRKMERKRRPNLRPNRTVGRRDHPLLNAVMESVVMVRSTGENQDNLVRRGIVLILPSPPHPRMKKPQERNGIPLLHPQPKQRAGAEETTPSPAFTERNRLPTIAFFSWGGSRGTGNYHLCALHSKSPHCSCSIIPLRQGLPPLSLGSSTRHTSSCRGSMAACLLSVIPRHHYLTLDLATTRIISRVMLDQFKVS